MDGFCPQCGAALPDEVAACPECGSCEETGWSERARYEAMGVDYDADEFDYDAFVENEFGEGRKRPQAKQWFLGLVAVILTILFLLLIF